MDKPPSPAELEPAALTAAIEKHLKNGITYCCPYCNQERRLALPEDKDATTRTEITTSLANDRIYIRELEHGCADLAPGAQKRRYVRILQCDGQGNITAETKKAEEVTDVITNLAVAARLRSDELEKLRKQLQEALQRAAAAPVDLDQAPDGGTVDIDLITARTALGADVVLQCNPHSLRDLLGALGIEIPATVEGQPKPNLLQLLLDKVHTTDSDRLDSVLGDLGQNLDNILLRTWMVRHLGIDEGVAAEIPDNQIKNAFAHALESMSGDQDAEARRKRSRDFTGRIGDAGVALEAEPDSLECVLRALDIAVPEDKANMLQALLDYLDQLRKLSTTGEAAALRIQLGASQQEVADLRDKLVTAQAEKQTAVDAANAEGKREANAAAGKQLVGQLILIGTALGLQEAAMRSTLTALSTSPTDGLQNLYRMVIDTIIAAIENLNSARREVATERTAKDAARGEASAARQAAAAETAYVDALIGHIRARGEAGAKVTLAGDGQLHVDPLPQPPQGLLRRLARSISRQK